MSKKRIVKIVYYGRNEAARKYFDSTGRLLGIITDETFSKLHRDKATVDKVLTGETMSLLDVVNALELLDSKKDGARLIIALHTRGGNKSMRGRLLITPRIGHVTSYDAGRTASEQSNAVIVMQQDDLWARVEEMEE